MKRGIFLIAVALILTGTGAVLVSCGKTDPQHAAPAHAAKYHCPMHPTVVSDKPGDCPICGMKLVPIEPQKKIRYRSTMNPGEVSDKPGQDSMGMEMVAFEVAEAGEKTPGGWAAVEIMPAARNRMGLTLGAVEKRVLVREIRAAARIVADETKLYHVNVKVAGWVEKLFVATTGQYVQKGEPLLTLYSPELMTAQAEHLSATGPLREAARRRLELLDLTDAQIARLEDTKQINKTLTLYAPASGYVIERNIAAGHKLTAGDQVLALADLADVWADAEMFQDEASLVKIGDPVEITVGDAAFAGKVSFIAPMVDAATRTVKVRMQIPNPDTKLKLEMWATARLKVNLGERLAIPAPAVLRTGEHSYAFKDDGSGRLTPVEIKIGPRSGDWFALLAGLEAGDRVVTSANFLVDSESQLKAALAGMSPP